MKKISKKNYELLVNAIKKFNDLWCEDLDIMYHVDEDDLKLITDSSDLRDVLERANDEGQISDTEIIYYSNAIKYLGENDPSLTTSLELASDMGYTADKLNSEMLASILASDNNRDDYNDFIDRICDWYDENIS